MKLLTRLRLIEEKTGMVLCNPYYFHLVGFLEGVAFNDEDPILKDLVEYLHKNAAPKNVHWSSAFLRVSFPEWDDPRQEIMSNLDFDRKATQKLSRLIIQLKAARDGS